VKGFGERLTRTATANEAHAVTQAAHPSQRRIATFEKIIEGDIDECFALACPVAELLWIKDWKFDLIYSESAKNETGCVFLEPITGLAVLRVPGANTYWYTTLFDTKRHRFSAVWVTRDLTIAYWEFTVTDLGGGRLRLNWSLTYKALGPKGNRIIAEPGFDERMRL